MTAYPFSVLSTVKVPSSIPESSMKICSFNVDFTFTPFSFCSTVTEEASAEPVYVTFIVFRLIVTPDLKLLLLYVSSGSLIILREDTLLAAVFTGSSLLNPLKPPLPPKFPPPLPHGPSPGVYPSGGENSSGGSNPSGGTKLFMPSENCGWF